MTSEFGEVVDQTGALGTNSWGKTVSGGGAFLLEVILTFVLVFVVLLVARRAAAPGFAGLAIGLTLAVVHLVGIPLDGTSVNPARSLGPAVFARRGCTPGQLRDVWLFILAPLVGAVLASGLTALLETPARDLTATEPVSDPTGVEVPA